MVERMAGNDYTNGHQWGVLEDSVASPADTVELLNLRTEPVILSRGKAMTRCPAEEEGYAEFYTLSDHGVKSKHTLFHGSITPPVKLPVYQGVLITGLELKAVNLFCSEFAGGALVLGDEGENDSLTLTSLSGAIFVDAVRKNPAAAAPALGPLRFTGYVDARGRMLGAAGGTAVAKFRNRAVR
jgi:hypothetical protein